MQTEWKFGNGDYRLVRDNSMGALPWWYLYADTLAGEQVRFHLSDDAAVELYNALGQALWPTLEGQAPAGDEPDGWIDGVDDDTSKPRKPGEPFPPLPW